MIPRRGPCHNKRNFITRLLSHRQCFGGDAQGGRIGQQYPLPDPETVHEPDNADPYRRIDRVNRSDSLMKVVLPAWRFPDKNEPHPASRLRLRPAIRRLVGPSRDRIRLCRWQARPTVELRPPRRYRAWRALPWLTVRRSTSDHQCDWSNPTSSVARRDESRQLASISCAVINPAMPIAIDR